MGLKLYEPDQFLNGMADHRGGIDPFYTRVAEPPEAYALPQWVQYWIHAEIRISKLLKIQTQDRQEPKCLIHHCWRNQKITIQANTV